MDFHAYGPFNVSGLSRNLLLEIPDLVQTNKWMVDPKTKVKGILFSFSFFLFFSSLITGIDKICASK